jgi:hypothetical protein
MKIPTRERGSRGESFTSKKRFLSQSDVVGWKSRCCEHMVAKRS